MSLHAGVSDGGCIKTQRYSCNLHSQLPLNCENLLLKALAQVIQWGFLTPASHPVPALSSKDGHNEEDV